MWAMIVLLCTTGTPYECSVERAERHETRLACLHHATEVREELEPLGFGLERVRDCARRHRAIPILPTRKPNR